MNFLILLKKNNSITFFWLKSFLSIGLFILLMYFAIPLGIVFNDFLYTVFGMSIPFLALPIPIIIGIIATLYFTYWLLNIGDIDKTNENIDH